MIVQQENDIVVTMKNSVILSEGWVSRGMSWKWLERKEKAAQSHDQPTRQGRSKGPGRRLGQPSKRASPSESHHQFTLGYILDIPFGTSKATEVIKLVRELTMIPSLDLDPSYLCTISNKKYVEL